MTLMYRKKAEPYNCMPLVGDQAAAVHGCSSGFADGLAEHPQGRKKNSVQPGCSTAAICSPLIFRPPHFPKTPCCISDFFLLFLKKKFSGNCCRTIDQMLYKKLKIKIDSAAKKNLYTTHRALGRWGIVVCPARNRSPVKK